MGTFTQVFIAAVCIVAVAESRAKYSPVTRGANPISSFVNDVLGIDSDEVISKPRSASARDVSGDSGNNNPGTAERPDSNNGRSKPPFNDAINEIDNLTNNFPKNPVHENLQVADDDSSTTETVTTISSSPLDPDPLLPHPIYSPDPVEPSGQQPVYPQDPVYPTYPKQPVYPQEPVYPTYPKQPVYPQHQGLGYQPQQPLYPQQPVYSVSRDPVYPSYPQQPLYPPHGNPTYPPQQLVYPTLQEPVYPYPQQPQQPVYQPQQPRQPYYPPRQPQPLQPIPEEPIYSQQPQQPNYPTPQEPIYPPQQPHQPLYPPQESQQPIYPPNKPIVGEVSGCPNINIPNLPNNNMGNHSIIIINLNDLPSQYGGMTVMQLLNILKGKPGFVYVLQSGSNGKFIPLTHLHLLPQNGTPSYIVLLVYGQPNPILNPGLQPINGYLPSGKLGFLSSNFGGLDSLPIYLADSYYAIMSILSSFGIYYPEQNSNFIPPPYPGVNSIGGLMPPAPISPAISPVMNDLENLLQALGQRPNGNGKYGINMMKPDATDFDSIKLLLQLLNIKPGYGTEENIYREKHNPANLLRIIIDLLGKQLGLEQPVNRSRHENNPTKLLQILIELMREGNASGRMAIPENNENKLIQLLMTLITNQKNPGHISSQSNLLNTLIQILGKQPELLQMLAPGTRIDNPSNLLEIIKKIPNIANGFGENYLNLGGNSGSGVDMNKLYQIMQIMLKEQSSNPTIIIQDRRPMVPGDGGVDANIMNMLLESGGGRNIKTGLWSYLLGQQSCVPYEGRRVLCAK